MATQDEDNNAQSNCPENTTDEKNQLCFDVTKGHTILPLQI